MSEIENVSKAVGERVRKPRYLPVSFTLHSPVLHYRLLRLPYLECAVDEAACETPLLLAHLRIQQHLLRGDVCVCVCKGVTFMIN